MTIRESLSDNRNVVMPYAASLAVAVGDLMYWASTRAKPITALTTGASEDADQLSIAALFLGASQDARLSTETDDGAARVITADGIFDCDCVSFSPAPGDLVGVTWDGGSALVAQKVKKVTTLSRAIGSVIGIVSQAGTVTGWGSAATKVRCRLVSRLVRDLPTKYLSAGVGYVTGDGGAVTQITTSSTGVTLSTLTGQITTVALTTAAAAEERFTVTNTKVAATDVIVLSTTYNGAGTPALAVAKVAAGAFDIIITNLHASAAFDAVMVLNFAVIKGVAA